MKPNLLYLLRTLTARKGNQLHYARWHLRDGRYGTAMYHAVRAVTI